MFRHHDEAANVESVPDTRVFEHAQKRVSGAWISEQWVAMLTAECDEVKAAGLLETLKAPGHEETLAQDFKKCCDPRRKYEI
jgi:hypothetical protein